jgi:GDP-L-fucose synthase
MDKNTRILVAGHSGLIGSAVVRRLTGAGYADLLTPSHSMLDLTNREQVRAYFEHECPQYVVLAAGKVGGIVENMKFPADFMAINLAIQLNVFQAARDFGIKKLIFFGSSCMYPKVCEQPMSEDKLMTGAVEPTSKAYALAKLAGVQHCLAGNAQIGENRFIPVIPNSAFGPNDDFNPDSAHVLSALIARFSEARMTGKPSITLWGSGRARREFVHADDIASACELLLERDLSDVAMPLNIGTGRDYSINELATLIAEVVGYTGDIAWDTTKPEGTFQKLLDSSRIRDLGWAPVTDFRESLRETYDWYLEHVARKKAG